MKNYKGTIVLESLIDERMLNDFQITGFKVTDEEDPTERWHLFTVHINEEDIERFSKNLKPQKWYAHFWNGDNVIAVFPDKVFHFRHSDKSTWNEVVEYGKLQGIPEEQLDFLIEE